MTELNEYHKMEMMKKQRFQEFMQQHPLSRKECLSQFKRLREQRISGLRDETKL